MERAASATPRRAKRLLNLKRDNFMKYWGIKELMK